MKSGTRTGGRAATTGVIPGRYALSVGSPDLSEPEGFRWTALTSVARLESGHTPSRSHQEYWDGDIPWIGIRDATANHGLTIDDTIQHVSRLGIDNSSARVLPAGTVCLSRTASVGFVVRMGTEMATSQDFVNWVCGPELSSQYLTYLLMLESDSIRRFASGSVHQTMYYPEAKALHALLPSRTQQESVVELLAALDDRIGANVRLLSGLGSLVTRLVAEASGEASLGDIARLEARQLMTHEFPDRVAHYSFPAFDEGARPVKEEGSNIKSAKFLLQRPCVLISKLNPRFPRVWDVPALPEVQALASTEFVVLEPMAISTTALWAALSQASVAEELESRAAGTSGSHQRVKPSEIVQLRIPDPRLLPPEASAVIDSLGVLRHEKLKENAMLAELRDTLLGPLMSGRLKIKDAARVMQEVV